MKPYAVSDEAIRRIGNYTQIILEDIKLGPYKVKTQYALKSKSYEEIQMLFDNEMRIVNTFIPMDSEEVKSKKGIEESSKGTEDELKSDR
ncbi:hypothetical protein Tco_1349104 [Tanacetum coccineum]